MKKIIYDQIIFSKYLFFENLFLMTQPDDCAGERDWVQVLCNGGIPTQLSLLFLHSEGPKDLPIDFRKGNLSPHGH